jgi:5'(3')-deoxyribonucleotidase
MSLKKRYLVDCDGVLADFVKGYLKVANRNAGTQYTNDDVRDWEISVLPGLKNVQRQTLEEIGRPGWALTLDALPGAQDGMKRLVNEGEVYIVTSPLWLYQGTTEKLFEQKLDEGYAETFAHDRVLWLERNFGIHRKKIIFASEKHLIEGDVLIDDKSENISGWLDDERRHHSSTHCAVVWAQPWNKAYPTGPDSRVLRTNNWSDAISWPFLASR